MFLSDFDFELPEQLIAQVPPANRSDGRLLCLDSALPVHQHFIELPELLNAGDLLVMNDTRVFPARLHGRKATGGKVELLVERVLSDSRALCLCRASKSPPAGSEIVTDDGVKALVNGRQNDFFDITFELDIPLFEYLEKHGSLPLPPYIQREAEAADKERYQTVYSANTGAVAAPTAGLHFDNTLLKRCVEAGIDQAFLTLHVGAGTFQPVRENNVENHHMHSESLVVSAALCEQINECKARGGRIVAVGTTVVRALETAALSGNLQATNGDTDIFIKQGFKFNVVDLMITNFHLPKSTLLMLVCAFGGYQRVLNAYKEAVAHNYRFFSYGDAMLLTPETDQSASPREV